MAAGLKIRRGIIYPPWLEIALTDLPKEGGGVCPSVHVHLKTDKVDLKKKPP